jgi:RHS repeat-associated protein
MATFAVVLSSVMVSQISQASASLRPAGQTVESALPGAAPVAAAQRPVPVLESPVPVEESSVVPVGVFAGESAVPVGEAREEPVRVEELVESRSATSDAWLMSDGSLSVESYAVPRYFRSDRSTGWERIDTTLVPDDGADGRVRSRANSWVASFGASNAADGMQQVVIGGTTISFSPIGASEAKPEAKGSTATYRELWKGTDVVYDVSAEGVDERIVLLSADVPSLFEFDVQGAEPRLNEEGGIDLLVDDALIAVVPPLTVDTARTRVNPERAGAAYRVTPGDQPNTGTLAVSVDTKWLAELSVEAFPVVIDPTVFTTTTVTQMMSYPSAGFPISSLRVGVSQPIPVYWRAKARLPIPNPAAMSPGGSQPWQLVFAQMNGSYSGGAGYGVTVFGSPLEPMNFNDVLAGGQPITTNNTSGAFSADVTDWIAQHPGSGAWFGLVGDEHDPAWQTAVDISSSLSIIYRYYQSPNPTSLQSPSGTIATTTPFLQAIPVTGETETIYYRFQVGTDPGAVGNVVDSGWIASSSWQVPAGSLADGATYNVKVWAGYFPYPVTDPRYVPPATPSVVTPLTVKKRLGAGGPTPTDTVGSVPGSTQTPSEGAPSPGVSPASVTVNMVTGNLALSLNTHPLSSLAGAAGVTLSYDSIGSTGLEAGGRGLSARYFTGSTLLGQRVDPTVDFSWPGSPMGGYLSPASPVTADWAGTIKVPATAGGWHLGGSVKSGTMKIFLDGSATAAATITSTSPTFTPALGWAPNSTHSIRIEYTSNGARGLQLWAWDDSVDPTVGVAKFIVPSGWLTPNSTGMPLGWRLSANAYNGSWTRLDDLGNQVVLRSSSGDTATFKRLANGSYVPPAGSSDLLTVATSTVAGVMTAGEFTLSNETGTEIVFGGDGWVRSVRTISDDRRPTALQYSYAPVPSTGSTPVLTKIKDPVTAREITLCYGATSCDTAGFATSNAPAGKLARIQYWDGAAGSPSYSTLVYDASGRFVRLINPGNLIADLQYDSAGRLTGVRDPLANDALGAGQRPDCVTTPDLCLTKIAYSVFSKVSTVTQPAPTPGAQRTARTYTYTVNGVANTAKVSISGFNPASGWATWVKWDDQGRIVEQKDSEQRLTRTVWDAGIDRVLTSIDPLDLQTVNVYDAVTFLLTDTYGPAPASCFSTAAPYTPTGACAVAVPRTQHRYDEGINGLAATFWNNPYLAGSPVKHTTGPQGTGPTGPGCTANTLCTQWNTLPVSAPAGGWISRPSPNDANHSFTWSMRLSGIIDVPTSFRILTATTQQVDIYLNGTPYSAVNPHTANTEFEGQFGEWWTGPAAYPALMPAGKYRIRIDYLGAATTTLNGLYFSFDPGPGAFMSNSLLSPDYGLETTTIDPDAKTVATSYTNSAGGIGPELGLVTTVIQDPAGLALTTSTSYESPTSGRWYRKTASTLPAGAASTTTYKHYCSTPTSSDCGADQFTGAIATACGVAAGAAQWGMPGQQTDPAPNPTTSGRAQQFLYDTNARVAGRRVGTAASIGSAPWQCTSYDLRGRTTSQTWPAVGTAVARTTTYTYGVGGNPLTSSVADSNGTITSTVDLLGRVTSYTDTNARTTTYTYDQAGRVTTITSPNNTTTHTYTPNASQLATVTINSGATPLANAAVSYDSYGRTAGVSYNNGAMVGSVGYDAYGRQTSLVFDAPNVGLDGTRITGNIVSRSTAGRQVDTMIDTGLVDLVDPNPAGNNYLYDGAGRLATAHLFGGRADYDYAGNITSDSCASYATGINPQPGRNTNRTGIVWTPTSGPTVATRSCFNTADQLVATKIGGIVTSGYTYDGRGNQLNEGTDNYTWDSSDRFAGVASGTITVSYLRDAVDRPIRRTQNGIVVRYGFNGYGDSADVTLNSAGAVLQQLLTLPGGVTVTVEQATLARTWSYPNLNGHTTASSDNTGNLIGGRAHYDPWGAELAGSTTINNTSGNIDLTAYGTHGKLTERATSRPITLMGARPFNTATARFLTVDAVKGGCANDYTYAFGDPVNQGDLTGRSACPNPNALECGLGAWNNPYCALNLTPSIVSAVKGWTNLIGLTIPTSAALMGFLATAFPAAFSWLANPVSSAISLAIIANYAEFVIRINLAEGRGNGLQIKLSGSEAAIWGLLPGSTGPNPLSYEEVKYASC